MYMYFLYILYLMATLDYNKKNYIKVLYVVNSVFMDLL